MQLGAVLLAGGKSTRMGEDKALLDFEGEPLWQRQLKTLRHLHPDRLLISGPARKEWEECEVVSDEVADAGPLAGVSAALRTCATPLLVVLAIDLPLMTAEYLSSLLAISGSEQGVVPVSFRGPEPLAAIYPLGTLPLAQASLESGDYSMRGFVAKASAHGLLRSQPIAPNELKLFTNLNTVSDYERARPRTLD